MFVPQHLIHMVKPYPHTMVLGRGAFGRWLGLYEVMTRGPHDGMNVLIRRGRGQSACSAREDTARGQLPEGQEVGPHQTLDLWAP